MYQGYRIVGENGKPTTKEAISEMFHQKYGYKPDNIIKTNGGILAGPIIVKDSGTAVADAVAEVLGDFSQLRLIPEKVA